MSDTDQFDDQGILARTLWGEARGEGNTGMQAIAAVVLNRVQSGVTWWGNDVRSVCLKPWQFSCWNRSDPNRPKLLAVTSEDPQFAEAAGIAASAIDGSLSDPTDGATSYYDSRMPSPPVWADGKTPCATIGHHLFFKA